MKCYSQVGDFAAFKQLKERISSQINQSERILHRPFDPALKKPDRPDRLLKSRALAQILRFYLERSVRYGIFDVTAAQEARGLLESIEQGYEEAQGFQRLLDLPGYDVAMIYSEDRGCIVDYLGTHQHLAVDIDVSVAANEHAVGAIVTVPLTQGQYDALVSFTYNEGAGHLKTSTLLKDLNAGNYASAAAQFGVWLYGGGMKLPGLVTRRVAEEVRFGGSVGTAQLPEERPC